MQRAGMVPVRQGPGARVSQAGGCRPLFGCAEFTPARISGKMKSGWKVSVRTGLRLAAMALLVLLAGCAPGSERVAVPGAEPEGEPGRWRHARAVLFLGAEAPAQPVFRFSGLEAGRISVAVASVAGQRLWVSGQCDGPGVVEAGSDGFPTARGFDAGGQFTFELAPRARSQRCPHP